MASEKQSFTPIPVLAGLLALGGTGKLLGAGPARQRFTRAGYSRSQRRLVGAVELCVAVAAAQGLQDADLRRVAGAGALVTTLGELRSRSRAGDGKLGALVPLLTGALGLATYLDLTLDVEA